MAVLSLSLRQARHLQLAAQGLLRPAGRKACSDDLISAIRQMSLLQIDTIHVVARSPYLVLFSRLGEYPQCWLEEALSTGRLFEYWAHEACFIPIEDYALFRHRMLTPRYPDWKYNREWVATWQHEISALLEHISKNGPVRSADFASPPGQKPGWWAWKPQKRHLENLFSAGELMVKERRNFQRVYDLRQNVLPAWNDALQTLDEEQAVRQMLRNSAASLGIFRTNWLADYYRLKGAPVKDTVARWRASGEILPVNVETLGECYLYQPRQTDPEVMPDATHTTLLSPFDPLVWDRKRARELFGFDYRLECYTPEEKRQYGYFVLPVLHRGALKGRLDAKMLRKEKTLLIKQFWLQPDVKISQRLLDDVRLAIVRFARWQSAEVVRLEKLPHEMAEAWPKSWMV
ncbi:winged helix-turn-helix domain-containing protein [Erwinia psidii]|uniref:Winged helix-turn-helix domain-containing protein n=1 Tax=Erwinia psidii TaxID=69224 RepID=A0A3N6S093_9GAMM|nr:crosslink repair DNA glycosylase YcaQ family protein [Erwinia psidii]MCX8957391.1 winged helix-turn-helix domain-containing protein [Erwinia psidii]MCX8959761.1 winged helix-turn-helix domain-containing protein [Erwinia psidii]MCX8964704.1 winged helix-turn-helix domain-containing protein [Erwinia psidii]RQM38187.1 winged helix-turn-helix domain-containing protein [Erwinia psidii]